MTAETTEEQMDQINAAIRYGRDRMIRGGGLAPGLTDTALPKLERPEVHAEVAGA